MVLEITKAIAVLSRGIAFFAWVILVIVRVIVNVSSGISDFLDTLGEVTTLWSNDIDNDDSNDSTPPPSPKSLQELTKIFNTAITVIVVVLILLAILFVIERILTLVFWIMEMILVWTKQKQDADNAAINAPLASLEIIQLKRDISSLKQNLTPKP